MTSFGEIRDVHICLKPLDFLLDLYIWLKNPLISINLNPAPPRDRMTRKSKEAWLFQVQLYRCCVSKIWVVQNWF